MCCFMHTHSGIHCGIHSEYHRKRLFVVHSNGKAYSSLESVTWKFGVCLGQSVGPKCNHTVEHCVLVKWSFHCWFLQSGK